jgi:hypothetical protein
MVHSFLGSRRPFSASAPRTLQIIRPAECAECVLRGCERRANSRFRAQNVYTKRGFGETVL